MIVVAGLAAAEDDDDDEDETDDFDYDGLKDLFVAVFVAIAIVQFVAGALEVTTAVFCFKGRAELLAPPQLDTGVPQARSIAVPVVTATATASAEDEKL